jgi:hypothetical protein
MVHFSNEVLAAALGACVSLIGAVISTVFGIVAHRQSKASQFAAAESEIGNLYDNLMEFRATHPEVLPATRSWTSDKIANVYRQDSDEDRLWATYYSYVELCIGYCNSVLANRELDRLRAESYEGQHEKLVKLLLTENAPIIADFVAEGKYVSRYLLDVWNTYELGEWNWLEEHNLLTSFQSTPNQALQRIASSAGALPATR